MDVQDHIADIFLRPDQSNIGPSYVDSNSYVPCTVPRLT
jgi:hypothetical protein